MKRLIEQWRNCDPNDMARMSEAAVMYALQDAKDDILLLYGAIEKTLAENRHLADGDDCTLIDLKRAIDCHNS